MHRLHLFSLLLAAAVLTTGCLGKNYTIPRHELDRLAASPNVPIDRIRVVQDLSMSETAKGRDPCRNHDHRVDVVHPHHHHGVQIQVGHHVHHNHRHHATGRRHGARHRGPVHGPKPRPRPARPVRASGGNGGGGGGSIGGGSSGGSSGGGSGGGGLDFDIVTATALVAAIVFIAAGATVAAVTSEGVRFDGWAEVSPQHPVHLLHRDGRRSTVHLADLRGMDVPAGTRAVLRPGDGRGKRIELLERAPLDREGFVWRMEAGAWTFLTPDDEDPSTFASTMQFGYYPHQRFGVVGTLSVGWGEHDGNDLLGARYGIEAQAFPLDFGPFHLGAYAMGGQAYNARDNGPLIAGQSKGLMFGTGLLSEIELTTRLALSMRVGAAWRQWGPGHVKSRPAMMGGIGFSVY